MDPQHRSAPGCTALCRLEIRGSPPAGVTADIGRRFGPVEVVAGRNRTALRVLVRDQAALRSLLTPAVGPQPGDRRRGVGPAEAGCAR